MAGAAISLPFCVLPTSGDDEIPAKKKWRSSMKISDNWPCADASRNRNVPANSAPAQQSQHEKAAGFGTVLISAAVM